jgi:diguanylate cyclase (GGDEF)-like protein
MRLGCAMLNQRLRVLLVSDSTSDVELARELLEVSGGYEVLSTDRLEKAVVYLGREKLDAVLLKLDLPDSAGINSLLYLKEKTPTVPILVISEVDDRGLGLKVIQSGAQDFLVNFGRDSTAPVRLVEHAVLRKRLEDKSYYLAFHDEISGLPNRFQFFDRLQHAITFAERSHFLEGKYSLAVLALDLDKIQEINESYGESVGNIVIKKAAEKLHSILRKSDTVASLGRDRFGILLEGASASEGCTVVAQKILRNFANPLTMNGFHLSLETSIGVSRYPENGSDSISLFKSADNALMKAKKHANCFILADPVPSTI